MTCDHYNEENHAMTTTDARKRHEEQRGEYLTQRLCDYINEPNDLDEARAAVKAMRARGHLDCEDWQVEAAAHQLASWMKPRAAQDDDLRAEVRAVRSDLDRAYDEQVEQTATLHAIRDDLSARLSDFCAEQVTATQPQREVPAVKRRRLCDKPDPDEPLADWERELLADQHRRDQDDEALARVIFGDAYGSHEGLRLAQLDVARAARERIQAEEAAVYVFDLDTATERATKAEAEVERLTRERDDLREWLPAAVCESLDFTPSSMLGEAVTAAVQDTLNRDDQRGRDE